MRYFTPLLVLTALVGLAACGKKPRTLDYPDPVFGRSVEQVQKQEVNQMNQLNQTN